MASQALSTPANSTTATPAAAPGSAGSPAAQPSAGLPAGIEIFRAGTHRDDAGNTHTFTRAQLEEMAGTYNATLREAPLTVGHPKDNLPAYGWVQRVFINDAGNLAVDPHQVDPAFAAMVVAGRFKKRSASFYPPNAPHNPTPGKWYLRHVAFLGAQPPAVAGLKDIGFAEFGDLTEAVSFSETPTPIPPKEPSMSDTDKAELERLRAEAKANADARAKAEADAKAANDRAEKAQKQVSNFAEKAAADRRASYVSFAESEIKAGRLLPKDKNAAVAALETLATAQQPLSFSEGSSTTQVTPLEMCAWLQGQMSSRTAVVSYGEFAASSTDANAFDSRGKSDAEIDQAARRYQADHPTVSYAEALGKVVSFGA
ncbi:hypothetical protein [Acidovorax sp. SUPP2825]|uniref:hypothetical protein n=1 Tax=Acidovorax sp. SUPP2825 TaxID=2920879 RepID=UPI0023DE4E4A|nr:hypothetical protein [Acidovorax sp. SUPP2825]GKS97026.1 peptidase [Acidovorax sp. SUPP2825]